MSDIQSLIDRQLGIYCRLNYDNVLKRLMVDSEESFYGLQSGGVIDTFDQDPPIFACRFAEAPGFEHVLALANEDGRVAIQDTTSVKTASSLESFQCHNNAVFDLAWMPGHMNFVTVSGDHTACLWDVAEGSPQRVLLFAGHTRSVKTAAFRPAEPSVFASGARDGHILVWDVRAGSQPAAALRPDNRLVNCHAGCAPKTPGSHGKRPRLDAPRAGSITGLVFRDERTLLSCGECDGNIKAWDLRKNYSAYTREPLPQRSIPYCGSSAKNGYTSLVLDAARTRLYASCMDDVIYCFNVAAYGALPERRYAGHENGTFYVKAGLSADGAYLVSGSSDKNAYVWNVRRARPLALLGGHRAEVTCAAWCQRGDPKLVTCGDDARHKIWRVGPEFPPRDVEPQGRAEPAPAAPAERAERGAPASPRRRRAPAAGRGPKRCLLALLNAARDADGAERPPWRCPEPRAAGSPPAPPERREEPPPRAVPFGTPTEDLPDFVRDGEAPHLRLMSPAKKKREAPDWLTLMARERRGRGAEADAPAPSSKDEFPPRRNSVEKTPKSNKKNRTLLKYFSVTGKYKNKEN